jgi:hypothetical protein
MPCNIAVRSEAGWVVVTTVLLPTDSADAGLETSLRNELTDNSNRLLILRLRNKNPEYPASHFEYF